MVASAKSKKAAHGAAQMPFRRSNVQRTQVEEEQGTSVAEDSNPEDGIREESDNEDVSEQSAEKDSEGGESDDEDENEDSKEEIIAMRRRLAHVPFETLAQIQSKMDEKQRDLKRKRTGEEDTDGRHRATLKDQRTQREDHKRSSKNKPMEMSSKKPVGRFREVVEANKHKTRDPRFDSLSGKLNEDLFRKSYEFLEKYSTDELMSMKNQLKRTKDAAERERLQKTIKSIESKNAYQREKDRIDNLKRERKKKEAELIASGKKPFFLKKSQQKQLALVDKFNRLASNANGGTKAIDKMIEKRRKKNATKQHRGVPTRRH